MKLAIMQPYFFPYIGYFQAIKAVDIYILYENLDYITKGWMNKNRILIKNGGPQDITLSLKHKSSNTKIYDTKLDTNIPWKKKIIKTLELNYSRSKYFDESFNLIKEIILADYEYLHEYNAYGITNLCKYLNITTEIKTQNKEYLNLENKLLAIGQGDYSEFPHLERTKPVIKTARIIEICRIIGASVFVNAIGGRLLYNKEELLEYGIELYFIETLQHSYQQFSSSFIPNLSIIDVLMHNGRENCIEFINNFRLI